MSGFAKKYATFEYKYAAWHPDSVWRFRSDKDTDDDDAIAGMTTKTIMRGLDQQDMIRAYNKGEDVEALVAASISQETVMSAEKALIAHMSDSWDGPDFTLDADYEDESQPPDPKTGKRPLHPLAGQVPPCTPEWIGLRMDSEERTAIVRALKRQYSGRSAAEQADFRKGPVELAGSPDTAEHESEDAVSSNPE